MHHYALCNFEAIEYFNSYLDQSNWPKHIFSAVKEVYRWVFEILEYTLRLLSLVFKYGMQQDIVEKFRENYKLIDIIAWIDLIPLKLSQM